MYLTALYFISLFIFGAAVGSFTSVAIYRLHAGKRGIVTGRSECPKCERTLRPLDLIPIASYLMLRGKCRSCSKAISYMYPALEIITGALFALLFARYPFLSESLVFSGPNAALYALHAFYIFVLVFTFFFDLHYLNVADEVLVPAIIIALVATIGFPHTPHIIDALLGAALGVGFFGLQYIVSRGTWIGLGDLRVGAFMGAILGWQQMVAALFISYMVGSLVSLFIVARKKKFSGIKVPFAPFLVTGTLAAMFWGEEIVGWYLGSIGL